MRSLERRFAMYQRSRPEHSSLMHFTSAIKGQAFSKDMISRWFNRLVDTNDYARNDKRAILHYLLSISWAEENEKQDQTTSQSAVSVEAGVLSHQ